MYKVKVRQDPMGQDKILSDYIMLTHSPTSACPPEAQLTGCFAQQDHGVQTTALCAWPWSATSGPEM